MTEVFDVFQQVIDFFLYEKSITLRNEDIIHYLLKIVEFFIAIARAIGLIFWRVNLAKSETLGVRLHSPRAHISTPAWKTDSK